MAEVAIGGLGKRGRPRRRSPGARARERGVYIRGRSPRVSERRAGHSENGTRSVATRYREWSVQKSGPGKSRKNSSPEGQRRGEEEEREMTGCSHWRLAPAFPS